MKRLLLMLVLTFVNHLAFSQTPADLTKHSVETGGTSFYYYATAKQSKSLVILFHDWFGISELSYEMARRVQESGKDAILIDLYKGKSAKTNAEAGALMNSIDQANAWNFVDKVVDEANGKYDNIYLWGFSLGTLPASETAIKHNDKVKGLVLFYGNVTRDPEKLVKMTFPSLMVMGSKDNPNAAIAFFQAVDKVSANSTLFIYPNMPHAFAQKLFNGGRNYNEKAKEASLEVAFTFLKDLEN
ncbi:MAG: hypothetical protein HEP71_25895 [Roseivirga sp.]|nr:hypothetical protein [Roseivirga sp.]